MWILCYCDIGPSSRFWLAISGKDEYETNTVQDVLKLTLRGLRPIYPSDTSLRDCPLYLQQSGSRLLRVTILCARNVIRRGSRQYASHLRFGSILQVRHLGKLVNVCFKLSVMLTRDEICKHKLLEHRLAVDSGRSSLDVMYVGVLDIVEPRTGVLSIELDLTVYMIFENTLHSIRVYLKSNCEFGSGRRLNKSHGFQWCLRFAAFVLLKTNSITADVSFQARHCFNSHLCRRCICCSRTTQMDSISEGLSLAVRCG